MDHRKKLDYEQETKKEEIEKIKRELSDMQKKGNNEKEKIK